MQMRYWYRIKPTAAQKRMLARVFGCARVVFNDALRVRHEAYRCGIKLSDSEIQRRVITQAKTTEQRAWLAEMPSLAWCSRSTTPGGPGATSSTRRPGNARAASWAGHG